VAGKCEEKRPLGRLRRGWDDIRIDLTGTGWEGVNWIQLPQEGEQWRASVNTVMNRGIP